MLLFIDVIQQAGPFAQLAVALFLAILFLQSGLDKVFDWKGNLGWLKGHFANSPLKGTVPVLLLIVTIFEVASGILSAVGAVFILLDGDTFLARYGAQLSGISILMLFFGQRIAKDYPGAATLVPYFVLVVLGILILG